MKVIILAGNSESHRFIYHGLNADFEISHVLIEEGISRKKLIKGRIKRIGYIKVINQLFFQVLISPILAYFSKKQVAKLKQDLPLDPSPIPKDRVSHITSVNSQESIDIIKKLSPDVILVIGTRIISSKVLESSTAYFINTHVGITPQYRGVHGAYWALANEDIENCGVTIHRVDKGIDTGGVILQAPISFSKDDNFATYKYIQFSKAIDLLKSALETIKNTGNLLEAPKKDVESNLYYHPTATGYLYRRIFKGIK